MCPVIHTIIQWEVPVEHSPEHIVGRYQQKQDQPYDRHYPGVLCFLQVGFGSGHLNLLLFDFCQGLLYLLLVWVYKKAFTEDGFCGNEITQLLVGGPLPVDGLAAFGLESQDLVAEFNAFPVLFELEIAQTNVFHAGNLNNSKLSP